MNRGSQMIGLRPFEKADWPICWRWITPHLSTLLHDDGPQTQRQFVDSHIERGSRNFGVYRDSELVGLFICDHVSPMLCEAHVYFKRSFLGRENTIPALRLGIEWAFTDGGYHKITSPVFESNRLMIRALKELGAVQEACFRAHVRQNGQPVDVLYFSIFKEG